MKIEQIDNQYKITYGNRTCIKKEECKDCPLFKKLKIEPDHENFRDILAVGEGPGAEERIKMSPFTGPSGIYLRGVEEDVKVDQFGIGHTNIILCEGGKRLEFDDPDALWDTIDLCTGLYLWNEIDELKPKLVVPMGNFPKSVFLPDERKGIGACAGVLYEVDDEPYNIMPIHHPAHVIRNPKMHERYWDEWNEVRLYFTEKPGPFTVSINDPKAIEILSKFEDLMIDFETTSFSPWDSGKFMVDGKEYEYGDILCLSLCGDGLNSYVFTKKYFLENYEAIKNLLERT